MGKTSVAITVAALLVSASRRTTAQQPNSIAIHSVGNPILSDGSFYSADPAPIVVGDTLYILTGRDTAPPDANDFRMPSW